MPAPAIRFDGAAVDLSSRVYHSSTVVASPTDATETIIASVTLSGNVSLQKAVYVQGWCAFTAGTNGVSARLRLKPTDASGTAFADTGAVTAVAASLYAPMIQGVSTSATLPGQVYVLTLTVGSASAGSTVSAVWLEAFVV